MQRFVSPLSIIMLRVGSQMAVRPTKNAPTQEQQKSQRQRHLNVFTMIAMTIIIMIC
jgi:hypothetical protein